MSKGTKQVRAGKLIALAEFWEKLADHYDEQDFELCRQGDQANARRLRACAKELREALGEKTPE